MAQTPPNNQDGPGAKMRQDADTARDTVRQDWDQAKTQARKDFDEVKQEARQEFDHARQAAGEYAEGQKNMAADHIEGLASAFDRVGGELRDGERSWVGRYASDIAGRLEGFAQHTRSSSIDDLAGDVERFGREQPAAFLAGAALLGFAATRFFSASASRRSRSEESQFEGRSATNATGGTSSGNGGGLS